MMRYKHGTAKLLPHDILDLRLRDAQAPVNVKYEADRFNCSPETIRRILRGETYRGGVSPEEVRPSPVMAPVPTAEQMLASLAMVQANLAKPQVDTGKLIEERFKLKPQEAKAMLGPLVAPPADDPGGPGEDPYATE